MKLSDLAFIESLEKNFKVLYQDYSSVTVDFTAKEGSANSTQEIQDGDVITQITQQVPESYHKILAMKKTKKPAWDGSDSWSEMQKG